jgi:hypothetical protein
MATRPEQVVDFLRRKPTVFYCDECITKALKMPERRAVQQITATLALCSGFTRTTGICSSCKRFDKLVIKAN